MSDLRVTFSGDLSQLRSVLQAAKVEAVSISTDMRSSFDSVSPAIERMEQQLMSLNEKMAQVSDNTGTLRTYANLAAAITLVAYGFNGLKWMATSSLSAVGTSLQFVRDQIVGSVQDWIKYNESIAYVTKWGPLVRMENDGIRASIGRVTISIGEYFRGVQLLRSGLIDLQVQALGNIGVMDRLDATARQAGLGDGRRMLLEYTTELTRIPGMTDEMASKLNTAFASVTGSTATMVQMLGQITSRMTGNAADAEKFGTALAAAFSNPAANGETFLNNLGGIDERLKEQFRKAVESNQIYKMQAALVEVIIEKQKGMADELTRNLRNNYQISRELKDQGNLWAILGEIVNRTMSGETREAMKLWEAMKKQIAAMTEFANQLRSAIPDAEQLRAAVNSITLNINPLDTQLGKVNSQLDIMRMGLQGGITDASALLRKFEGFREKAYWDTNAFRVGYGSDTTTRADGTVEKVTESTIVTREDAERDLARRIRDFQLQAAKEIGPAWNDLSAKAKASITSVIYNYGSLTKTPGVLTAARSTNDQAIAQSIAGLAGDNGGINANRRRAEAANVISIEGGGTPEQIQALRELEDRQLRLNQAKLGGTIPERLSVEQQKRLLTGKQDEIRDQKEVIAALEEQLKLQSSDEEKQKIGKQLDEARLKLKRQQNELKRQELELAIPNTSTREEERDAKIKLAKFDRDQFEPGTKEYIAAQEKIKAANQEFEDSMTADKESAERTRLQITLRGIEEKKDALRAEQNMGRISRSQLLQGEMELEQQRITLERSYWQKRKEETDAGTNEHRQALARLEQIEADASLRRQRVTSQAARSTFQDWKNTFDQIGNTVSSSVMSMIQGTATMKDLFRNVTLTMIQMFVQAGVKMVTTWLANQATMIAAHITGEAAMTGATAAGASARTGIEGASILAVTAMKIASIIKSIISSAAQTFAGVFGFMAPIMGPAAAGPAAASSGAVLATIGSVAAADIGMWNVPSDQLAVIHKRELIMPAAESEAFRSMLSGAASGRGGGGRGGFSASVPLYVKALDSRSVSQVLGRSDSAVVKALTKAISRGAASSLRNRT